MLPIDASKEDAIAFYEQEYSVGGAIHADDHIFNFVINHPVFTSPSARVEYYFRDGARSAQHLSDLLARHLPQDEEISLLEFASGYGCVTRHLKNLPNLRLTSCDIHPAATSFLRDDIGVDSVQSANSPEALELPQEYDAVFALSFFSHMPISTWERWLRTLIAATRPGGVVIFTTQGIASGQHFGWPEIPSNGFWFQASSEQADLSTEEYGQTIVTPHFVHEVVASIPEVEFAAISEGFWWGHQDMYVLRRLGSDEGRPRHLSDRARKGRVRRFINRLLGG